MDNNEFLAPHQPMMVTSNDRNHLGRSISRNQSSMIQSIFAKLGIDAQNIKVNNRVLKNLIKSFKIKFAL